ncbi:concanavalin A-like lectin/glucanase domain-containing protein [Amylocarpus encephaloides]|uniref:Concanavalin A-like lectin/glucanase domain-containing protein n=1 Tax=Amylocarpus encephaloides TaxID=45428 RepID=A0A9P8C4J6_9HELO|nr:concanavalin A-like lectin/glucanase domain-containing protein [Amylocarpus encephaloides]
MTLTLSTLTTLSSAITPEQISGFKLIWSDDFSGSSIDSSKWVTYTGTSFNREQQKYINSPSTCSLTGSSLLITPRKDSNGAWTSCKIESTPAFAAEPGGQLIVQARFKLGTPGKQLQGIWPAFWNLGENVRTGTQWPECGEIDTFENINGSPLGQGTIHCGASCNDPTGLTQGMNFDYGTYHTWAHAIDLRSGDWRQQSITWYMDGQAYHVKRGADLGAEGQWRALVGQGMYMLLNVAVGGGWPGDAVGDTVTGRDAGMEVGYVGVYRNM